MPLETTGKHRKWSKEEDDILREYYPTEGRGCISRLERRTSQAIGAQASRLRISRRWSKKEEAVLLKYYLKEKAKCVNYLKGRTKSAIKTHAFSLGLVTFRMWCEREDAVLRKYYPIEGGKCKKRLEGRTKASIFRRALTLGIKFVPENLVGKRFGRLRVIQSLGLIRKGRQFASCWLCECDCGKILREFGNTLKTGHARSCGCLQRDIAREQHILPKGEAAARAVYRVYKDNARKKKRIFALSFAEALELFGGSCSYCGAKPYQISGRTHAKGHKNNGVFIYNGIDRVDNSKGYLKNNCVPCCGICNRAKAARDIDEFQSWIARVCTHWLKSSSNTQPKLGDILKFPEMGIISLWV